MNPAVPAQHMNAAYARLGALLGQTVTVYRPDARQAFIPALDARFATVRVPAWFNPDPAMRGVKPPGADAPIVYAAIDPAQVLAGDYLIDAEQSTWFVGPVRSLFAVPCVHCNRAFSIARGAPATGADTYGGNSPAAMTPVLTCWPGFIVAKPRGIGAEERVPGDTKLNVVVLSLPVTPGVEILPNDLITDDQGRPLRYTVSLASVTDWGWTIEAYYAGA